MNTHTLSSVVGVRTLPKTEGAQPTRGGAAFEVLLEKLQTQAQDLQRQGSAAVTTEHLTEAVGAAKTSLTDALDLGDQLLEAYREALHQNTLTISRSTS